MKLYIAQTRPVPGALQHNFTAMERHYNKAAAANCDLVIFPELSLTGYNIKDLSCNIEFLRATEEANRRLAALTGSTAMIFGTLTLIDNGHHHKPYNSAVLASQGKIQQRYHKKHLPNYDVFDEARFFTASDGSVTTMQYKQHQISILICEDAWHEDTVFLCRDSDLIVVINASPYTLGKEEQRSLILSRLASFTESPVVYVNQVGGQDELVFDGRSRILHRAQTICLLPAWEEVGCVVHLTDTPSLHYSSKSLANTPLSVGLPSNSSTVKEDIAREVFPNDKVSNSLYHAVMHGLRDYCQNNSVRQLVLGLSGGIDSALVAILAADALGATNLHLVALPSCFSSPASLQDAQDLANNLQCRLEVLSIEPLHKEILAHLKPLLGDITLEVTDENIQARLRGLLLMAIANKTPHSLLLNTSNKSESALGYCTLFGDMCGGFAPIADLYKSQVYALAHWRNRYVPHTSLYSNNAAAVSKAMHSNDIALLDYSNGTAYSSSDVLYQERLLASPPSHIIPQSILTKAPSAELRPDQLDSDTLPPYNILDPILYCLVEADLSFEEAALITGNDVAMVKSVAKRIWRSEFKRRQAAIAPVVSRRSFRLGHRYPVTLNYHPGA